MFFDMKILNLTTFCAVGVDVKEGVPCSTQRFFANLPMCGTRVFAS